MFNKILELESTTGIFCGHDHFSNCSVKYRGVEMTYAMLSSYGMIRNYGFWNGSNINVSIGGTILTIAADGTTSHRHDVTKAAKGEVFI
jgi:hypothetical protein